MSTDGTMTFKRLNRAVAVAVGVFVALGLVIVVPFYAGHYVCVRGGEVGSQFNYTPELLLNSPYGGWGNATYQVDIPGTSGGSGASFNGSADSVISGVNWTLWKIDRVLVNGIGVDAQCPGYQVESGPGYALNAPFGSCSRCPVMGPGNESDQGEPSQLSYHATNGTSYYRTVIFDNAWNTSNQLLIGTVSTCGRGARTLGMETHDLTFRVPFVTPGGTLTFNETIYSIFAPGAPAGSYSATYSYWFPPNFGTWGIENLSAPGGPGGGWAFEYRGCG